VWLGQARPEGVEEQAGQEQDPEGGGGGEGGALGAPALDRDGVARRGQLAEPGQQGAGVCLQLAVAVIRYVVQRGAAPQRGE
jgi:hypothetical protein